MVLMLDVNVPSKNVAFEPHTRAYWETPLRIVNDAVPSQLPWHKGAVA